MADDPEIDKVGWIDITVNDAPRRRDFYAGVTGWNPEDVSMRDYSDFMMVTPSEFS